MALREPRYSPEDFGDGDYSDPPSDEDSEQHDIYGPCPWGHWPVERGPDCCCPRPCCRNIRKRLRNWRFHQGYYKRPMRVIHPDPPRPGPNVRKSCTEMIPWNTNVKNWTDQCPNSRALFPRKRTESVNMGGYQKDIRPCCEAGEESGDCMFPADDELVSDQDPPGPPDDERPDEDFTRYVCEDHIEDSKNFWELEKFHKAHLVGTCKKHRIEYKRKYQQGLNTCTCHKLFERWQCRRCFERKIFQVQNHFRRRVAARHDGGRLDVEPSREIFNRDYHLRWRGVRALVARKHPCSHFCGRKRILSNEDVMDCRACGGLIVQRQRYPLRSRPIRSQRGRPIRNRTGQPVFGGGLPPGPHPESEDGSDDGDQYDWDEEYERDLNGVTERDRELFSEDDSTYKDG